MQLVILAAGMGSRFGGLKQMEPVDDFGNFIIDYSVYDAIEAGFDSVVFIIKHAIYEDFKNTIGKRLEGKIKVLYAFQELDKLPKGYKLPEGREKPFGTAHAILCAKDVVSENFAMINADDFYGRDAFMVAAKYLKSLDKNAKGKFANVVYQAANTMTENGSVKRGVCLGGENGYLKQIIESSIERVNGKIVATPLDANIKPFTIKGDTDVSMNMFIFTKDIMDVLDREFPAFLDASLNKNPLKCEYLIPDVASELNEQKKATIKLLNTSSVWYGFTYKEDKEKVVAALKSFVDKGEYKKGLW